MQSQRATSFCIGSWIKMTASPTHKSYTEHSAKQQNLPLSCLAGALHVSSWGKARIPQKLRLTQRNKPSQQTEMGPAFPHRTPQRGSFCTYHNPCGRAQIKFNHKSVLAGQEGDPRRGHKEIGPGLEGLVWLPPIRQDAENIKFIF